MHVEDFANGIVHTNTTGPDDGFFDGSLPLTRIGWDGDVIRSSTQPSALLLATRQGFFDHLGTLTSNHIHIKSTGDGTAFELLGHPIPTTFVGR